jgi:FkbM family methyltransferase
MTIETVHWHTLHPRFLDKRSNVLDLGSNYGLFARSITERFGCHCVAVEPSPEPFSAIPESSLITKLQAAISDQNGVVPFHVAPDSVASSLLSKSASLTATIIVPSFSLPELVRRLGWPRIDLLKIDIEGSEISMFATSPDELLRQVAQISVEFHDFCGITSLVEVKAVLARLHRLGFYSVRMSRVGHQDTWLINRRLLNISKLELLFIKYVVRNWMGFKRITVRISGAGMTRLLKSHNQ